MLAASALLASRTDALVTVVDLKTFQETAKLAVRAADVDQLQSATLLRDRTQYYVVLQVPPDPKAAAVGLVGPNFVGPIKTLQVNGMIYAFDRADGRLNWATDAPIEQQQLLLDSFEESPVLLMTVNQQRQLPGLPGGNVTGVTVTRSIDKRTGKVVYRKEINNDNNPEQFYLLEVNARTGTVDLVSASTRLRHMIEPASKE